MPDTFSTRRMWKHVGIVLGVLFVLGGVAASLWAVDKFKFGEGLGRLMVFAGLVTAGVSYLWQTGRRRWAMASVVVVAAIVGGATWAVVTSLHGGVLSDADRAPLVSGERAGKRVLTHPTLGFTLLEPESAFKPAPEAAKSAIAASFPDRKDVAGWLYQREDTGEFVLVMLVREGPASREGLDGLVSGLRSSLVGAGVQKSAFTHDAVAWSDGGGTATLAARLPAGPTMHCRFLARQDYVAGVIATVDDPALAETLAGSLAAQ